MAFEAILASHNSDDGKDNSEDEDDGPLNASSTDVLKAKIKELERALARERKLVKCLQESNIMLQKGMLPCLFITQVYTGYHGSRLHFL